jgi:hypothetical protein
MDIFETNVMGGLSNNGLEIIHMWHVITKLMKFGSTRKVP